MSTPANEPLDTLLFPNHAVSLPSRELQIQILNAFWCPPESINAAQGVQHHDAYFQYLRAECDVWRASGCNAAIHTYRDLVELVIFLQAIQEERRDSPRIAAFFQSLLDQCHSADNPDLENIRRNKTSIDNAINFAVRVWLMLNVGAEKVGIYPGKTQVEWQDSEGLQQLVHRCFPNQASNESCQDGRIPYAFNAYNLERIGGLEIVWTDHLPDHLKLNEDLCTVSLYHHARILKSFKGTLSTR